MRLEHGQANYKASPIGKFQFHKGAIRTKKTGIEEKRSKNFNSIKVRLELNRDAPRAYYEGISIP